MKTITYVFFFVFTVTVSALLLSAGFIAGFAFVAFHAGYNKGQEAHQKVFKWLNK